MKPHVRVDPSQRFGRPAVRGVTAETLAEQVAAGATPAEVAAEYADYGMRREDVLVACWYMARHGPKRWRRLWRHWLRVAGGKLWHGHYDQALDPPSREGDSG